MRLGRWQKQSFEHLNILTFEHDKRIKSVRIMIFLKFKANAKDLINRHKLQISAEYEGVVQISQTPIF